MKTSFYTRAALSHHQITAVFNPEDEPVKRSELQTKLAMITMTMVLLSKITTKRWHKNARLIDLLLSAERENPEVFEDH